MPFRKKFVRGLGVSSLLCTRRVTFLTCADRLVLLVRPVGRPGDPRGKTGCGVAGGALGKIGLYWANNLPAKGISFEQPKIRATEID